MGDLGVPHFWKPPDGLNGNFMFLSVFHEGTSQSELLAPGALLHPVHPLLLLMTSWEWIKEIWKESKPMVSADEGDNEQIPTRFYLQFWGESQVAVGVRPIAQWYENRDQVTHAISFIIHVFTMIYIYTVYIYYIYTVYILFVYIYICIHIYIYI